MADGFCAVDELKPVAGLHEYEYVPSPPAPVAPMAALPPLQMVTALCVAVTVSGGLTVTVTVCVAVQPLPSVAVTVYVVVVTGVTLTGLPVSGPGVQLYVYELLPPVAEALMDADCPMQMVEPPAVVATTAGLTNTVTESVPWQPFTSVTITEYVVVTVGVAFGVALAELSSDPAGLQE